MSLEQAIHQRWASGFALAGALPAARVFTGTARGNVPLPYAVIARLENRRLVTTSSGTGVERTALRIHVWAGDLDEGQAIVAAVRERFDRAEFALAEGRVLNVEPLFESETQQADGAWLLSLDYAVVHLHTSRGNHHG